MLMSSVTFLPSFHPHLRGTQTSDDVTPTKATEDAHPTASTPTTTNDAHPNTATDDGFITPDNI